MPGLFNKKILEQRIKNYEIGDLQGKLDKISGWKDNLSRIKGLNEVELQSAFIRAIFEDVLGYENAPQKDSWTLNIEPTTDVDAKNPDATIGFYEWDESDEVKESHRAVIELKGPQISLEKDQKREKTTYKSPVDQAFNYTNKLDRCRWVIVSNFTEIRLYQVGRSKEYYETFYLSELDNMEEFKEFHYILRREHLISKKEKSITFKLTEKTQKRHEDISVEFYNLYKDARVDLFEHLKDNNENEDPEILLEKAQKFLDRIIFICFCEDKGLLPNDLLHEAIKKGKESYVPVWEQIKGVFKAVDKGSESHNINAYDGGLFAADEKLDSLKIQDDYFEVIYKISDYDFDSDMDVNILGHIFEQSITDIEKLKSDIKEDEFDKNESKRKKDGIYYTPRYITSYIVESAVGGYLEDIKEELGYYELPDIEEAGSESWKTRYTNQHLDFYREYEEKLKEIKILDPACGSGAFLNQAFDYLLDEHQWLNKQRDILQEGYMSIFSLKPLQRDILKNNLYGVDLNDESVEITKLSLWLKTANKERPLTNLDDNIRCGNSLIDDPGVAGDKAFVWEEEFPEIMAEGGFDVVIGNPPYVNIFNLPEDERKYFQKEYYTATNKSDLYAFFIENVTDFLLKQGGFLGFIVSNTWTSIQSFKNLRELMLENLTFKFLSPLSIDTFQDANVKPLVFIAKNNESQSKNKVAITEFKEGNFSKKKNIPQNVFRQNDDYIVNFDWTHTKKSVLDKINNSKYQLGEICKFSLGIKTANNDKFLNDKRDKNYCYPVIKGKNIKRYYVENPELYLWYAPEEMKKRKGAGPRRKVYFLQTPKIVLQEISGDKIIAALDDNKLFALDTVNIIYDCAENMYLEYILAILNSKTINFWYSDKYKGVHVKLNELRKIPIKVSEPDLQIRVSKKVRKIQDLKNKYIEDKKKCFIDIETKFVSNNRTNFELILSNKEFTNKIYTGRARKIRDFTVNINTNIVTLYSDKSGSGRYELLKFQEDNRYKRKYLKYYLESLTEEQLDEMNEKHEGNLLEKVLQIKIPDYEKDHVVKKIVKEWEDLQREIERLESEIEKTDMEIDRMVYDLYGLTDEEIKIVEEELD